MRVLINHFYCYCSDIFCKCLVIGKMFLSLSAIFCFSCLFWAFGFVLWGFCWVWGFLGIFCFGVGVGFFWRGGVGWVGVFLKGNLSCSLPEDPGRVVVIFSGLFQYIYRDEKYISLFFDIPFQILLKRNKSSVVPQKRHFCISVCYLLLLPVTTFVTLQLPAQDWSNKTEKIKI